MQLQFWLRRPQRLRRLLAQPNLWRTAEHYATYTDANANNLQVALDDVAILKINSVGDVNLSSYSGLNATNKQRVLDSLVIAGYRVRLHDVTYGPDLVTGQAMPLIATFSNIGNGGFPQSAPLQWELRSGASIVQSWTSSTGIEDFAPNSVGYTVQDTITVPQGIAAGTYTLTLSFPANGRRSALAYYTVGTVNVIAA
jgi:hypothetical protein